MGYLAHITTQNQYNMYLVLNQFENGTIDRATVVQEITEVLDEMEQDQKKGVKYRVYFVDNAGFATPGKVAYNTEEEAQRVADRSNGSLESLGYEELGWFIVEQVRS